MVVTRGKAATTGEEDAEISIDGVKIPLGDDELSHPLQVASKIIMEINTPAFVENAKSYKKIKYTVRVGANVNSGGQSISSTDDCDGAPSDAVCLIFERDFPGQIGNEAIALEDFSYKKKEDEDEGGEDEEDDDDN